MERKSETMKVKVVMSKVLKSLKYIVALVLLAIFTIQALTSINKVKSEKMAFTSTTQVEPLFTFPSLTICIAGEAEFAGGRFNDAQWPQPDQFKVDFPFKIMGYVSDSKFVEGNQFFGPNMNSPEAFEELGMNVSDVWTFSVSGQFGEPCPCYTYQPKGQRTSGFFNSIMVRFKGSNDPLVKYIIAVHNHNAFVPSLADIFGNSLSMVFAQNDTLERHNMVKYVVFRTNITELNRPDYNCSSDASLNQDGNPGLVMSSSGPKTVEQCIVDYYQRELGCQLPWNTENTTYDTCTTAEQYAKFRQAINTLIDNASKMTFWKIIQCQSRCQHTQYSLRKIADSNFNALKYMDLKDDGANMEIFLFATSTEIEVKERVWLYDGNDLVADIGGFLGLLLGASIYTLADLLLSNVEKFFV